AVIKRALYVADGSDLTRTASQFMDVFAVVFFLRFFFTVTASTDIYTLSLHDALPIFPRTPGNNVYVGFMVWSNFTATKCRGLVSLNQVIKEIICLQPLK